MHKNLMCILRIIVSSYNYGIYEFTTLNYTGKIQVNKSFSDFVILASEFQVKKLYFI